jgi:pre-mRNA-splicing factor ATP-dependent RNA helicase DHX15/PRP43
MDNTTSDINFDINSDTSSDMKSNDDKPDIIIPKNLSNIGILDPSGKNINPLNGLEYSDEYKDLGKVWSKFPAYSDPKKLIQDIKDNQVTLVISGTGSGKTVLFPKYTLHALKYSGKIGITLPKQMVAKSAAEFAAVTLDVKIGESVGYQYRGSDKSAKSDNTKLLYCTDGTMVSRLITDPLLSEFDAVIIDEAHERKVNIDFLLYLLRNVLEKRPEFRLIIMSATIDKTIFKKYFNKFSFKTVEIGGKTNYPIESIFLEKKLNIKTNEYVKEGVKIIKDLIKNIQDNESSSKKDKDDSTGILFFVTSVSETKDICDLMQQLDPNSNVCISVYSGMRSDQEKLATDSDYFIKEIGEGSSKIKLVIATNVAESSITIEGIKYVIDSGLELRSTYDTVNRVNILAKGLITHAQAKQRMGRTGRTGPGICYHLYLKEDFDSNMDRFPIPSIRSESITNEILRLLNMDVIGNVSKLTKVLNDFIEPPNNKSVESDLKYLENIGAINDNKLTELGTAIVDLQLDPEEARAVIMSYRLFVFREVIAIIAISQKIRHSISNLFIVPKYSQSDNKNNKGSQNLMNKYKTGRRSFDNAYGDLIALLKIFYKYEELRDINRKEKTDKSRKTLNDWMYQKFLKKDILESSYDLYLRYKRMLRPKLGKLQNNTSLIPRTDKKILDDNSIYKILACFIYGYNSNIIQINKGKAEIDFIDKNNKKYKEKIEMDKSSFIDLSKTKSKSKDAMYSILFKFGDNAITGKITTYVSDKSIGILDKLNKSESIIDSESSAEMTDSEMTDSEMTDSEMTDSEMTDSEMTDSVDSD